MEVAAGLQHKRKVKSKPGGLLLVFQPEGESFARLFFNNLEEVKCIERPRARFDETAVRGPKGKRAAGETAATSNRYTGCDCIVLDLAAVSGKIRHKREINLEQ
jgi:hypothetical protein